MSNNMFNNYMFMYYECSGIAVQSVWVNTLFHFLLLKKISNVAIVNIYTWHFFYSFFEKSHPKDL